MTRVPFFVFFILIVGAFVLNTTPVSAQSDVDGVWEITAASGTNGTVENVQPSLYLFQDGYYSILSVSGNDPRPLFEEDETRGNVSLEKLQEIILPVTANSGRYEIDGITLTTTPMVAINPNFMSGGSVQWEFDVSGDVLTLEIRNDEFFLSLTLRRLN